MSDAAPAYMFEGDRLIGTVSEVGPHYVQVNLPLAARQEPQLHYGERVGAGEVGEFVVIEVGNVGVFGQVTHVKLPERERLSVEPRMGEAQSPHPIGTVQLLTTIPVDGGAPKRGVEHFPRVGARVFSLDPSLVAWITARSGATVDGDAVKLDLAYLPGTKRVSVRITPERLFGRHCAVLGATGGGKSWSLAKIVERCSTFDAKVVLLDASGEYHGLIDRVKHVSLGEPVDRPDGCMDVVLPYRELVEDDLFALLSPSIQAQAPKLRAAIKSLKLAEALGDEHDLVDRGCIRKEGQKKEEYYDAYQTHHEAVDAADAAFDIKKLPRQIELECVYLSASGSRGSGVRDHMRWGRQDEAAYSYCHGLIGRINSYLTAPEFTPVFQPGNNPSVLSVLDTFLDSPDDSVLRISLRSLSFKQNAREIVANGIARRLLERARQGRFRERPVVVCVDEAHQFLSKELGDEYTRYPLDAFDLIAKEGRKYSLSICIATQRPRDIPEAVLGQMGTLLVHRLTNDQDRRAVERAVGDIDRSAAAFLPSLVPGQAVLVGVDYPIPLIIQVRPPSAPPDSKGPDFQRHWKRRSTVAPQG